jgi:uncharacterized membrane protein YbhN (UPF0104 family)
LSEASMRVRMGRAIVFSASIAAAAYLGFSFWAGWHDVASAFAAVGWSWTAYVLGLSLINYVVRFVRWQLYLSTLGHPVPILASCMIYFAGFAFTTTPGKAGEMLRGVFLGSRGVPFVHSTAAFLSERLSDLLAIVLICLLGFSAYPPGRFVVVIGAFVVALLAIGLSQKRALVALGRWLEGHSSRLVRAGGRLVPLLLEARRCHRPEILLIATPLSLLAWAAEAFAFCLVLDRVGIGVGLPFGMFIYAIATLAGALSFLPGGLGSAEAVMVAALLMKGAPEPQAVAATIIIRLATLWFSVALGIGAIIIGRRNLLLVAGAEAA